MLSGVSGYPSPLASPLLLETMPSKSSLGNKSKIHPEFNISLIGIRNVSFLIYWSVIIKTLGVHEGLAIFLYISCKYPLKSFIPKLLVTTIWSISKSRINAESLVKDYLPEPPTPTKRAFPPGISKILQILDICSIASENRTKFILALDSL